MDKANAAVDLMNNGKLVDDLTTWFNASHGSCDYFSAPFFEQNEQFVIEYLWEIPISEDRVQEIIPNKLYIACVKHFNIARNAVMTSYITLCCEDDMFWGTRGIFDDIYEAVFSIIAYVYDIPQNADNGIEYDKQLMRAFRNYCAVISASSFTE